MQTLLIFYWITIQSGIRNWIILIFAIQSQWRYSGVFIINFNQILHIFLVFQLLIQNQ